ncbi:MAG: PqqD family protein [Acidobacteria bacterium]|nr:PqqD family protein [Acidobacteriota bacterium]MCI0718144.1 PqqD family protein [Acidobacteriota bacterium]
MTEQAFPSRRKDVVCKELEGEVILFDPLTNVTHRLNQTASLVYLSCDGLTSAHEIVESYQDTFQVSSNISHRDVSQVLSSLEKLALLNYQA